VGGKIRNANFVHDYQQACLFVPRGIQNVNAVYRASDGIRRTNRTV
jgi:hypothetical protein